jgi:glycosyltransferase involved in cell wall biosynthesis
MLVKETTFAGFRYAQCRVWVAPSGCDNGVFVVQSISAGRPLVVVVAPVPPPLHGAAATTAGIIDFLTPYCDLRISNISPGRATGFLRHFVRIARTFAAMLRLLLHVPVNGRVLYMTADGGPGMIYNILVAATGTLLGYRLFLHHHSFAYVDRKTRLMAILSRILAAKGTHVVLCPAMAVGLRKLYPIGATFELSSAALLPPAGRKIAQATGPLKMGFLSNLIIEKGLDTSIDLLRAARAEGLDVSLTIAGRAPDQCPLDLIYSGQAELGEHLSYVGPLSDAEKDRFLEQIDVFLFPSRYFNEAQPRAVLEALAFGVPVLTIGRSCITTDMGEGTGLCAAGSQSFVAEALPFVRLWAKDKAALALVSGAAADRSVTLHDLGQSQLNALADAFRTA